MARKEDISHIDELEKHYKKKNEELEEREMELRCRLQMLENTMPALVMWNMWKMMLAMQQAQSSTTGIHPFTDAAPKPFTPNLTEKELVSKLYALEARINTEMMMLQESRSNEKTLRNKLQKLEMLLDTQDKNMRQIHDRSPHQDLEALDKIMKMAQDRIEIQQKIKDLEMKQVMYQETLDKLDIMFSNMDDDNSE